MPIAGVALLGSFTATQAPPPPKRTRHRHRHRHRPASLTGVVSKLPSSLPTATPNANANDPVLHLFLQDRQLHGDIISRTFDMLPLPTRSPSRFPAPQITHHHPHPHPHPHPDVNEETTAGYLRLVTTTDCISDTTQPPINNKYTLEDSQNDNDNLKKLNLLKYEALKGELLFLTIGIGVACTMYCLIVLSFEAAVSYSAGVFFSCLYLQLLYWHTDKISKDDVPEIFQMKKIKRKVGITSEDVRDNFKKILSGTAVSLSSPRLVIPALVYGLWALSQHFHNDILNFQLVPGVMGFFAYKAAALLQAYRDNEDLRMIFPENEESDSN